MPKNHFIKKKCRLCNSSLLFKIISFGKTPLANSYINPNKLLKKINLFPLDLFYCKNCYHLQIVNIVNPKLLFSDYLYVTGTSKETIKHFSNFAKEIIKKFRKKKFVKIIDLASNDGTFLSNFKSKKKFILLGVDPAKNLKKVAKQNGIHNLVLFFNKKNSDTIKKKYGLFDLVTANNVFAHIDNLKDFTLGVKNILSEKGMFVFEVSYLIDVIKNNTFDTIYHEHLSFHSITSLIPFFNNLEMEIIDVKRLKVQGGSIRVYVSKKNSNKINFKKINNFLLIENEQYKISKINYLNNFVKKINLAKKNFQKFVKITSNKKSNIIVGYGAAAKTTTFLSYFELYDKDAIKYIVEDNPLKQNLLMPNGKIKILPTKKIYDDIPDYVVIFAWNYSESIIKKNKKYLDLGGKFVIPFPNLSIISK